MPKYEMLNNIEHIDLSVDARKCRQYGDNVGGAIIFPEEFISIHKEYPIYFQRSGETGEFQSIVLFGFASDENLFLTESGWDAYYVPALMRRDPFLIGFQKQAPQLEPTPVVNIDMDSPRVNPLSFGKKVFLENGGNTNYLNDIASTLMLIHNGITTDRLMFEVLQSHDLIEPCVLDVTFENGDRFYTEKYYTVNKDKLYELDDHTISVMHRSGHLQLAYMAIESLSNIKNLITRKEKILRIAELG